MKSKKAIQESHGSSVKKKMTRLWAINGLQKRIHSSLIPGTSFFYWHGVMTLGCREGNGTTTHYSTQLWIFTIIKKHKKHRTNIKTKHQRLQWSYRRECKCFQPVSIKGTVDRSWEDGGQGGQEKRRSREKHRIWILNPVKLQISWPFLTIFNEMKLTYHKTH